MTTVWGYTLSSEEHPPAALIANARRAEEEGFAFVSISDHFHPWTGSQGHSAFVWSVIGGIAVATERIQIGTGVTCPILRIHPAIVAHAVATTTALLEARGGPRFFFGVGSGENLNEHVLGDKWPPIEHRLAMLEEAVELMRTMWKGGSVDHDGEWYSVGNARLYTLPSEPPPVVVSAMGPKAAEVAARIGDGLWSTGPDAEVVQAYRRNGGTGPAYAQITLCWAADRDAAVRTAHEIWPNAAIPGQLSQDLPTPTHFEQAAQLVTPEDIAQAVPCGPDPGPIIELVAKYQDAGFDHLYFHQIGPDQDGFFRFWREELAPKLPQRG